MENLKNLLTGLPPPPLTEPPSAAETPRKIWVGLQTSCQMCKRPMEVTAEMWKNQEFFDVLCPACERELAGTARLVCLNCRQVVCRLKPKRCDNGFVIEAGKAYHTDKCSVCSPGLIESKFLEIEAYSTTHKET